MSHAEHHRIHRSGWLRAAVLGANDGIVSTASLIIGVASAGVPQSDILLAGIAGLVAGAMSMAAGEYVSVCSQADIESADLQMEQEALDSAHEHETQELADIYTDRGLSAALAREVAEQLMAHDALGAHARDELGINENHKARPIQAAITSACMFTLGAALPLLTAWLAGRSHLILAVALLSLVFLASLGALAAKAGGAPLVPAALRVCFWGAAAMTLTAGVGFVFGIAV